MNLTLSEKRNVVGDYKRKDKISMLSTSDIAPNPFQPRKCFNEEEITFLSESIKQFGIIQPIAVKVRESIPCLKLNNDKIYSAPYEIIAGERRWRAAQRLGLKRIPCIIFETDKPGSAMLALVENIQRKELSYFEEATALHNLLLMSDLTQSELSKKLSVSQSSISNKLRLLKLTAIERDMITDGNLTERHARALIRIDDERSRIMLIKKIIEKNYSASQTEKFIDDYIKGCFAKSRSETKPTKIGIIKDMRFFYNTINRAIALLADAGINAKCKSSEYNDFYEFVIKVSKTKRKP